MVAHKKADNEISVSRVISFWYDFPHVREFFYVFFYKHFSIAVVYLYKLVTYRVANKNASLLDVRHSDSEAHRLRLPLS